jgi:hypothetical protein
LATRAELSQVGQLGDDSCQLQLQFLLDALISHGHGTITISISISISRSASAVVVNEQPRLVEFFTSEKGRRKTSWPKLS